MHMKRTLFFCNTYYQLLVAIQMKLTAKREDAISVILTDESRDSERVAEQLKAAKLFQDVFFLKTKVRADKVNVVYKLRAFWNGVFGYMPQDMPKEYMCDEFVGFNFDLATHAVFAALWKNNPCMACNAMEEGLLSYQVQATDSGLMRSIWSARRRLGKQNLRENVKLFYCFDPTRYSGSLSPVAIPKLQSKNEELRSVLTAVFLKGKSLKACTQKYIYLPCIYDMEGGSPIGELELAKQLAQHLGVNDLLVKVHPRDDAQKYQNAGLTVDTNSAVPFEVLCILQDYSKKVLITTLSGSVLNIDALLADAPKSYYAYPLCCLDANPMAQHFRSVIMQHLNEETSQKATGIQVLNDYSQLTD